MCRLPEPYCMMRKNDEYLVQQALQLLKADPRTVLATVGDTPDSVIEHLEEEGYRIQELDYYLDYYDTAPEMPSSPGGVLLVGKTTRKP